MRAPEWDGVANAVPCIPNDQRNGRPGNHGASTHRGDMDRLALYIKANPGVLFEIPAWRHNDDASDNPTIGELTARRPCVVPSMNRRGLAATLRNGRAYVWVPGTVEGLK